MTSPHSELLARWAPRATLAVPLLLAGWSVYAVAATHLPTPFADEWANVWWWHALDNGDSVVRYLLSQHNEHRLFFPRLVFLADWRLAHGSNLINLIAIATIQLLGAAFYLRAAAGRLTPLVVAALAFALSMMALLLQWENFYWGFQVQFVGVFVAGAWASYLFLQATAERATIRWRPMAGALALLTVATFSMANGFFVGIALVATCLATRRGLKPTLIAAAAVGVLMAVFLYDYHITREHTSNRLLLQHPLAFANYVLVYLGNIWAFGEASRAAAAGALGAAATLAMALLVFRDRGRDLARTSMFAVVLFIGLTAAVTAAGRLGLGAGQALASRYATPTCHFWAAQALFWALSAERQGSRLAKAVAAAALVVVFVPLLTLQRVGQAGLFATREQAVVGSSAILSGIDDHDALKNLYPDIGMIDGLAPYLREKQLATFVDDPGYRAGWRLSAPTMKADGRSCRGFIDYTARSPQNPDLAKMVGWGWDGVRGRRFDRVLVTTAAGQVLGVGLSGIPRPDVRRALKRPDALGAGWGASFKHGDGDELVAYGLMADGRACEVGRTTWPK